MAGVQFDHVTKRFQRVTAIADLCLRTWRQGRDKKGE